MYKCGAFNNSLPALNTGTAGKPRYTPAELLTIEEGQHYRSLLEGEEMDKMLLLSALRPAVTFKSINEDGYSMLGLMPKDNPLLVSGAGSWADLQLTSTG